MTTDQAVQHTVATHTKIAEANGTTPKLSAANKAAAEAPAQNPSVPAIVTKIDQSIVPGLTMKDKQALGFDKKASDKQVKAYILKEYLKTKVSKDDSTDKMAGVISQFENNTSRSTDGMVAKSIQQLFGTAKAMKYSYEQIFGSDLSDPADQKTFATQINSLFQNYGKTPDEATVYKYLAEAGVPKGFLGQ